MMLSGIIDTLMLSSEGDLAVGAVGTANSYLRMIIVMFNIAASGMLAVMTMYIGAEKPGVSHRARQIGLSFNMVLGCCFSLMLFFFSERFLRLMGISGTLLEYTGTYMRIVGGGCILNALIPIFSGHLRAFGHTKQPFYAALTGNVLNVGLNALFLFVLKMGVAGVAAATVISYTVNLGLLVFQSQKLISGKKVDRT